MSLQRRPVSRVWLGAVALAAFLALWAVQGFGGEIAMWREIAVHGRDLTRQVAESVSEMKQQLTTVGCNRFSLAYWSLSIPTRLHVEVRCREWRRDVLLESRRSMGRASHESAVEGSPRSDIKR